MILSLSLFLFRVSPPVRDISTRNASKRGHPVAVGAAGFDRKNARAAFIIQDFEPHDGDMVNYAWSVPATSRRARLFPMHAMHMLGDRWMCQFHRGPVSIPPGLSSSTQDYDTLASRCVEASHIPRSDKSAADTEAAARAKSAKRRTNVVTPLGYFFLQKWRNTPSDP